MTENEPRDRKDLKIQALLEKVSSLTTQYENDIADLRVEITFQGESSNRIINDLTNEVANLRAELDSLRGETPEEVDVEVISEGEKTSDDSN